MQECTFQSFNVDGEKSFLNLNVYVGLGHIAKVSLICTSANICTLMNSHRIELTIDVMSEA